MIAVQAASQVLQAPPGGFDVIARIRAGEDRAHPRPLALGELLKDVAALTRAAQHHEKRGKF